MYAMSFTNFNDEFYKWCNCEKTFSNITVKCYDYPFDAILANETELISNNDNNDNKQIIRVFKYMPLFMQKYTIKTYFNNPNPVIFLPIDT